MTYNQQNEIKDRLEPFFKLSQQWPNLILGGSLALIIQDKIPFRSTKDIDLVGHRYNVWDNQELVGLGSSVEDADCVMIKIDGVTYDYFIKPSVIYSTIVFKGIKLNVQYPQQIIAAKMQYVNKYNILKHTEDIVAYFNIQKNGYIEQEVPVASTTIDDDLPF